MTKKTTDLKVISDAEFDRMMSECQDRRQASNDLVDDTPDTIPESISRAYQGPYLPGNPTDRRQIRQAMHRIDLTSDAKRRSEIIRVNTPDGSEQWDFPGRQGGHSVTARVRITRTKGEKASVFASIIARNNIVCTEVYTDQNPNAEGIWIRVEYTDLTGTVREIFDRLEEFTSNDPGESPWDTVKKFSGITDKDTRVLKEFLSTHLRNCIANGEVKMLIGTSYIGWSDKFRKYSRPGYMDAGMRGLYSDKTAVSWVAAGSLEKQKEILLALFAESPRALMVAGFAVAGLLLRPIGINENYLLALIGADSSSLGKTTLLRAIKSFSSTPERVKTFDSTTKALKASTLYANDSCALIDEIGAGKLDQKERDALVYGLSAGVPRDSLVKENGEWVPRSEKEPSRFTVILSGEESLIDQTKARKGVKIRYTQLPISETNRLWTFNDSERIEVAIEGLSENYGHIFPAIVQMIQTEDGMLSRLKTIYASELERVRQRCGTSEKAKRKAHKVALAQLGVITLSLVLDRHGEKTKRFEEGIDAAHELLDDFIQEETSSDVLAILLSLPTALAPFLAVHTHDDSGLAAPRRATMPNRMIGSVWHDVTRYQHMQISDGKGNPIKSISDKTPTRLPEGSITLKGSVVTLIRETAQAVVQDRLGVDLKALVDEGVRQGWVKVSAYERGFRTSSMCKFIRDESGNTRNSRGYEFMIPDDYEAPHAVNDEND